MGKRVLAALMDAVFFALLWFIMAMYIFTPIANSAFGYSNQMATGYQYQTASHIYLYVQLSTDGTETPIEVKDYTEKIDHTLDSTVTATNRLEFESYTTYLEHVYYYYTSYLTNQNVELPNPTSSKTYDAVADKFVSPNWDKLVTLSDGSVMLPKDLYTTYWFNVSVLKLPLKDANAKTNEESPFEYPVVDGVIQYDSLGILKEGIDNNTAKVFCQYALETAAQELYYSDYYQQLMYNIKWIQVFIALTPYILNFGIVYFLFPLIFRNGETLGKKAMHLALVNSKDFDVSKPQILFRQLVLFAEVSLSLFVVGIGLTSIATLGVGVVIMLIVTMTNKKNKAPQDFAAVTYLIDAKKSVWFPNQQEEDKAEQRLSDNMAKYRSAKVENKHLIQVGDQIIDEDIKKEVDASKKTKKTNYSSKKKTLPKDK